MAVRQIAAHWTCQRSGDCCRIPAQIVMTREEANLLKVVRPDLKFYRHLDHRFVYLEGRPCPLLTTDAHRVATCTVHAIRPYNCRRFGCFRPDPPTEPYEPEKLDPEHGRFGCANLSDRLLNRQVRREFAQMQRKAQRWAVKHGWQPDLLPTQAGSGVTFYKLQ